ncbi:MAG: hypothetical protein AAGD04_04720 [Pseudomonadota bacterium]
MKRGLTGLLAGLVLAGCLKSEAPKDTAAFASKNVPQIALSTDTLRPKLRSSVVAAQPASLETPQKPTLAIGGAAKAILAGISFARRNKSEITTGTTDTAPPYGKLMRVCDVKRSDLGEEVARFPEKSSRYRLYDANPKSTGLRVHYVTGFKDGCALQVSGAMATFGSPDVYEVMAYQSKMPKTLKGTAAAYESIKAKACGAASGERCGGRKAKRFKNQTVFLSVYDSFAGAPRWTDVLLHDGRFVAQEQKSY